MKWGHSWRCILKALSCTHFIRTWMYYKLYIHVTAQHNRCTNYPNLFCYKTVHVSGILSVHHQEFFTLHSALVSCMQVLMTVSKESQDGTPGVPSWLCLETVIKTYMQLTSAECRVKNSWWWAEMETVIKTCMQLISAECTVKNSWWWAENMPEHVEFYNRINFDN